MGTCVLSKETGRKNVVSAVSDELLFSIPVCSLAVSSPKRGIHLSLTQDVLSGSSEEVISPSTGQVFVTEKSLLAICLNDQGKHLQTFQRCQERPRHFGLRNSLTNSQTLCTSLTVQFTLNKSLFHFWTVMTFVHFEAFTLDKTKS